MNPQAFSVMIVLGAFAVTSCTRTGRPNSATPTPGKQFAPDAAAWGRKTEGYRGIWFTLGQYYGPGTNGAAYGPRSTQPVFPYGDKYSGGLGTYTMKHTPVAIYSPVMDRTFFVYGGTPDAGRRYVTARISNQGTVPCTRGFTVEFRHGATKGPSLASTPVDYLGVGAHHDAGFEWNMTAGVFTNAFELIESWCLHGITHELGERTMVTHQRLT